VLISSPIITSIKYGLEMEILLFSAISIKAYLRTW
jgi:hypothetical protein